MLIGFLRTRRNLFQVLLLALLQPLILLFTLLNSHRLFKDRIIQIEEVIVRCGPRKHHPRQPAGIGIIFRLRGHTEGILTLPDGLIGLSATDGMQPISGRSRELQQSDLLLLRQQHLLDTLLLFLIAAVNIVGKRRRRMAAARQHPVRQQVVIAELHLIALRLLITPSGVIEVLRVLRRVAQLEILLSRKDGARHLRPILQIH